MNYSILFEVADEQFKQHAAGIEAYIDMDSILKLDHSPKCIEQLNHLSHVVADITIDFDTPYDKANIAEDLLLYINTFKEQCQQFVDYKEKYKITQY